MHINIKPDGWTRTAAIAQILGVVVTGFLALAAFRQISQSAHATRITVALAMHEVEPRFSMADVSPAELPVEKQGDTVKCTRKLRFRNLDGSPIRVIWVEVVATHSTASVADVVFPSQAEGDFIGVGDSTVREVEQKVHVRVGAPPSVKLHLCATVRRDDQARTFYYERVYEALCCSTGVLQATFTPTEYTGVVSGFKVILDPWYEPARDWWTEMLRHRSRRRGR